jgi:hypothetical protein
MTEPRLARVFRFAPAAFAASGLLALVAVFLPSVVFYDSPSAEAEIARPSRIAVPPLSNYAAIVWRPLFNDDRRRDLPPPPPAPPKPPAPPSAENYQLVGIILSSELRMALVQRRSDAFVARLHVGDTLDGWTVKTIDASGVQLGSPSSTTELIIPRAAQQSPPKSANTTVAATHQSQE